MNIFFSTCTHPAWKWISLNLVKHVTRIILCIWTCISLWSSLTADIWLKFSSYRTSSNTKLSINTCKTLLCELKAIMLFYSCHQKSILMSFKYFLYKDINNVLEIQFLTILMIVIIWLIFLQIWLIYNDVAEKLLLDDMLQYVTIRFIFQ